MDNDRLLQLRRLATDSLIEFVNDERVYALAQALEEAVNGVEVNGVEDFDSMVDKTEAYEEDNAELSDQVKEISESIREIYRITKSANSDLKRLAEIQEVCQSADVDLNAGIPVV